MEQYKLALVQMNCAFGEQEQNRKKAEQYIREAAKKGAALVCLPESFSGGYLGSRILDMKAMAEPLDGPSVSHMRSLAAEPAVSYTHLTLPTNSRV